MNKAKLILFSCVFLYSGTECAQAEPVLNDPSYILANDMSPAVIFAAQPLPIAYTPATPGNTSLAPYAQPAPNATQDLSPQQGAELHIGTYYDITPTDNINGGTGYGIDTTFYSPAIDKNWRLFTGQAYAHEIEPIGEGDIGYARSVAGVEYHNRQVTTSAAPTYNLFNGQQRVGAAGDVSWKPDDAWDIGGNGQLFSRDIPLRALNAGITANSYNVNATWTLNDRRSLRVDGDVMTFSDANLRTTFNGAYSEHLYANSHFSFDALATATESQNSEGENPLYYNPSHDVLGLAGGRVTEPLYQGHGIAYEHSLEIKPGAYWQENYGTSPAVSIHYAQRIEVSDTFDIGAGIIFSHQSYDGAPQNDELLVMDITKRF